ncbi:uncharacterized protein LOC143218753 [Lasioglossum baleicum]|uniref:uncharacterized protein LOC143218753 n=1 Tax=Lasioglossum baleicum TaxID=434251 RepID=UPI003FCE4EE2
MLRGHVGSLELIRGVFNPLFRRNFTATSVRCTDDNDRKKVEGVFSWLKDIFKSEVRVEEARNSIDVQIKDTPKDYPRYFAHNIQSCSSPEVASRVESNVDTKINSTSESVSHFGWYPSPLSRNLLLVAQRMDTQIRGVANCSPRNTKPPIREPNMPEKQQRKDDKDKKKKKKKPVLRTDASEEFPDIVAVEAGQGLAGNPDVNFRYQWGIKIPEEIGQATQDIHSEYIWGQASLPLTDNPKGLGMSMSTSDTEKSSAKAETVGPGQPAQSMEPSGVDETVEAVDKRAPAKIVKKAAESSKDNTPSDEDYNIPTGAGFDAEISAWKDLVLKSKVPIDTSNKDEFVSDTKRSADMLSIRPEPPEPKLDVQAIPSTNEDVMKDEDETDMSKDVKVNLKKLDGKRTGDVQKIDSKKLHTSRTYNLESSLAATEDHCSSRTKPRAWTWEAISGLPRLNVVTFSTSSERWASAEKINDTNGSEAALNGKSTSHDDVGLADVGNMNDVASPDQPQLLRQSQQYQTGQPEIDSDFEDSLNVIADRGIEISLQRTQGEQEIDDSKMNMADKDSMAMEAEHHHQHPNSLTQFEDDFVSGYESMSLEPTQEKSAKEDQKKEQPTDSDVFENESPVTNMDNYVSDGEYVKVPGDPYPYSKQHFEKWRMAKEEIVIGNSFVDTTAKDDNPEVPVGDARTRQIDNLPPARSMSHDMHMRNQLSRGKGVPD